MNLFSQLKILGVALALTIKSLPAFSFVERCEIVFNEYLVPQVDQLRSLVVRFEKTQFKNPGAAITALEGEKILHQIERAIRFAKLEDLLPFFEPETGLTPFMHHDPKLRRAVAQGIFDHPSTASERAQFLRKVLADGIDFDFFDEVLGLNKDILEFAEEDAFKKAGTAIQRSLLTQLGIPQSHDHWFSDHETLIGTLESARKLGVRRIVDLGSGTGRLGLLAGLLYPDMEFVGLEMYHPRVEAARQAAARWGLQARVQFQVQDLTDAQQPIPIGDYYFMLGPTNDLEVNLKVVQRLREATQGRKVIISSHKETTTRILAAQPNWLYRINAKDIPDGTLYTNTPFSEWLMALQRSLGIEKAAVEKRPEKAK